MFLSVFLAQNNKYNLKIQKIIYKGQVDVFNEDQCKLNM